MVEIEVGRNLSRRVASMQANGLVPNYEASMGKMFSTELRQPAARTGTKAFGLYANLWPGDERAPLGGEFAMGYCRTVGCTAASAGPSPPRACEQRSWGVQLAGC